MNGMKNNAIGITVLAVVTLIGFFALRTFPQNANTNSSQSSSQAVLSGNVQEISIMAKGGYTPNRVEAKADIPSRLRVTTENSYDCSIALTIPKLGIQKTLPPTGETLIDISPQPKDSTLIGMCSMGMYRFTISFI